MKQNQRLSMPILMSSLIAFILFWTLLTDAWGYSGLIFSDNNLIIGQFIYGYISRLIWFMPAVLLIFKCKKHLVWEWKQLLSKPLAYKFFIGVLVVLFLYCLIGMFVIHKGVYFNTKNIIFVVIKMIIVGIVEETVFRGWGYNSLCKITTDKKAILLSSVMFSLVHCPAYIIRYFLFGNFDFMRMLGQSAIAFIFGILFCVLLKKSKSLWIPICVHIFYDLLIVFIV